MLAKKPVVLCILDGWGEGDSIASNAISVARTPNWDLIKSECPVSYLETSGKAVGLPDGQMGNSEVGHTAMGSGRLVLQDLMRLDESFGSGGFQDTKALKDLVSSLKKTGGVCHLGGLFSDGGIHSRHKHIMRLASFLCAQGVQVKLHLWLDGRDTPPKSALIFLDELKTEIGKLTDVSIATLSGRFYAMDRDRRWERTHLAYDAMVLGKGQKCQSAQDAIQQSYENGKSDEFLIPCVVGHYDGMKDGDALLIANFRADRMRQICAALCAPLFDGFKREKVIAFSECVGLMSYSSELDEVMSVMYPPISLKNVLGEVISKAGMRQLRIAETEKYAHVTFFFNGGEEKVFPGEERVLIPSPKVETYDQKPEMSAVEITDRLIQENEKNPFDLTVVNYANPDMVGHTGNLDATVEAIEVVDRCLGQLIEWTKKMSGVLMVTSDHGNAEKMVDPETKAPYTAHTCNLVPFAVCGLKNIDLAPGTLRDVGPTVLELLEVDQPVEMTGTSLVRRAM